MSDAVTPYTGDPNEVDLEALIARASESQQNIGELLKGADFVIGRALVDKRTMIGVPHIITNLAFRKGNKDATQKQHDYVSAEFTTLPEAGKPAVDGVYNDGSTGIRRQLVQYLAHKGTLPADPFGADPDSLVWSVIPGPDPTDPESDPSFDVRLIAARGLRVSEYENDYTDEGVTFYLA